MPEGASTKLLLIVGAGVALAASAAVWLVPMAFLSPASVTGTPEGAPPFPDFTKPKPPADPNAVVATGKDWLALQKIDELRDKPPPAPLATEGPGVEPPPQVAQAELHWQYLGFAGTLEKPAAFMSMSASAQRVVFPNDVVTDANDPNGSNVTIKSIDPEKVVVEQNGKEQTFEIIKREASLTPVLPPATDKPRPTIVGGMPGIKAPGNSPSPATAPQGPVSPNTPGVRAR